MWQRTCGIIWLMQSLEGWHNFFSHQRQIRKHTHAYEAWKLLVPVSIIKAKWKNFQHRARESNESQEWKMNYKYKKNVYRGVPCEETRKTSIVSYRSINLYVLNNEWIAVHCTQSFRPPIVYRRWPNHVPTSDRSIKKTPEQTMASWQS